MISRLHMIRFGSRKGLNNMSSNNYVSNYVFWNNELEYIERIAGTKQYAENFNNDESCFIRYCEMQRSAAIKHGFNDHAKRIAKVIERIK